MVEIVLNISVILFPGLREEKLKAGGSVMDRKSDIPRRI